MCEDIQSFYSEKKRLPINNAEAGVPEGKTIIGNYVKSITVDHGSVHIYLGNRINKNAAGKVLSIRPALIPNEPKVPISWVYGYASKPEGMTIIGENHTSIVSQFLPINCRY